MANFNGNLNLMSFVGAKLLSGIDEKNPQRGYVCIPVDLNEIKVAEGNGGKPRASVRVNMWQINDALYNAAVRNAVNRGEEPPTREDFHTHTLDVSFSDDYVKAMVKAYGKKLIDKVLAANSTKHPEYATQDASDPTTALFKAVRGYIQPKLANIYQNRRKETAQQSVVMQTVQGVTGYVAPQNDQDPFGSMTFEDSDIPF